MPQRQLLQIGGLTFDSDITKFLIIIGAITFSAPVIWWCAHKGKAKYHAMQRARRQKRREALEASGEPNWGDAGSDSDGSGDWDIEKVLGEKVPIPRWAREDAAAATAAAAAGEGGTTARGGANTARSGGGGGTGRDTARSGGGAPGQTARTAGTGGTGRAGNAGTTRRDSVLSEGTRQDTLAAPSTAGGR